MQSVGGCTHIFKVTAAWPCSANPLLASPTGFLAPNRMLFPDGQRGSAPSALAGVAAGSISVDTMNPSHWTRVAPLCLVLSLPVLASLSWVLTSPCVLGLLGFLLSFPAAMQCLYTPQQLLQHWPALLLTRTSPRGMEALGCAALTARLVFGAP